MKEKNTKKNPNKVTGSLLIQAYGEFNYDRFLSVVGTTRYKIYRVDDSGQIIAAIAVSDPHFSKESFNDLLEESRLSIIETKFHRTLRACLQAVKTILSSSQASLLTEKVYVPGKKS